MTFGHQRVSGIISSQPRQAQTVPTHCEFVLAASPKVGLSGHPTHSQGQRACLGFWTRPTAVSQDCIVSTFDLGDKKSRQVGGEGPWALRGAWGKPRATAISISPSGWPCFSQVAPIAATSVVQRVEGKGASPREVDVPPARRHFQLALCVDPCWHRPQHSKTPRFWVGTHRYSLPSQNSNPPRLQNPSHPIGGAPFVTQPPKTVSDASHC